MSIDELGKSCVVFASEDDGGSSDFGVDFGNGTTGGLGEAHGGEDVQRGKGLVLAFAFERGAGYALETRGRLLDAVIDRFHPGGVDGGRTMPTGFPQQSL